MHSLLKRQLKRCFGDASAIPDAWRDFIDMVNKAYHESDMDRNMLERSLDLSSHELMQANSEMRAIFEAVPDIFFRVDAVGNILDCKTGKASDLFMSRENIIGKRIYDVPIAQVADQFQKALEEVRATHVPVTFEYSISLHGIENFCEARCIPILEEQTIIIIRNVTDRKNAQNALIKSEEYYREITTNSSDVLFIVDEKGIMTYVSPSVERYLGYRPKELMGKSALDFILPDEQERARENYREALKTTEVSLQNRFRVRHKNGEDVIMEGVGKNLLNHPAIAGFVMNARDVTDRIRAEEALKENEKLFRLITDNVRDVVWIMDMNLNITWMAPSVEKMRGFTVEELKSMPLEKHLTPASLQNVNGLIDKYLSSEIESIRDEDIMLEMTLEFIRREGATIWADTIITVLRDGQGKPTGLLGVARDTTEKRKMEDVLRESERKYRLLTEKMSDVVWILDMNMRTVYVTPSIEPILGFTQEERMQQTIEQQLTPESLLLARERMTGQMDLEKQGQIDPEMKATLILQYYHKDGSTRWMETVTSGLRNEQGILTGLHGVSKNITERKKAEDALRKSEERYRAIFENTGTANIIVAEDTTIMMANKNFADLCGYTKEELEGKISWTVFVHKDDLEQMEKYHRMRRLMDGDAPASYEFRAITRRGDILNLYLSASMIPETKESVISMIDLTQNKQLETQLIQAQKMESVGRLAGGVAHDFNNMLSVIIGNTEMALKNLDRSDPLYKTLQDVLNAGMRSADLTRQLLAFARKQTVSPKVLDLNDTITGMLKMLRRLIGEHIDLGWHPGHDLWTVEMDPSQVDQLLANLIVNARDAIAEAGKILIETANTVCDESYCMDRPECIPGEYVVIAVSDDGCGMDKETLASIFEPFFTTKKEGQGTGLGLATVYGIVKQNNGFVNVYSEPDHGTTFRIYIPRHVAGEDERGTESEDHEMDLPVGTETVLIVEDEQTVLTLSKAMLEMLGYKVLAANSKDQAFKLVNEYDGEIDLLLTDVVMPGMNGKELSERIRDIKPAMKCLFMSGYTADVIARQGVLEEGVKFIPKPFSLQDLAVKVREVLG